jgi:glycosyltransferase involved in cell wall biosynthesis
MRKVLIIAYYWPPSGGGGVQRWLKFTKYLPDFDWQPIVYVPYNPQYPLSDPTLVDQVSPHVQVIRGHIWEARRIYRRLKKLRHGRKWSSAPEMDTLFFRDSKELSWFGRLSLFLRSNLFVPDSRSLWIKPSVRRLGKWLKENPVDVIISTGPPHSCHLIGMKLMQKTGIPWIADFRDPWTDIDYFPMLLLTNRTRSKHERLQRAVLSKATQVITVSPSWADLFEGYGAQNVAVITNGFDPEDLKAANFTSTPRRAERIRIACIGTLEADRNPTALWTVLGKLHQADPGQASKFEFHFAGKVDAAIIPASPAFDTMLNLYGYVSHQQALELMHTSDLLLLILNNSSDKNAKGRIPGKLFEYLAFDKPLLLIGNPESDSAQIVSQLENSMVLSHDDISGTYQYLLDLVSDFPSNKETREFHKYERRHLTGQLADVLSQTVAMAGTPK